jgi:hypothetical protein
MVLLVLPPLDHGAKRLQLLQELAPSITRTTFLATRDVLEQHRSAMRPVVVPVLAAMAGPITPSMSSTTACSVAATGVPRERAAATNAAITRQCQSAVNR